MRVTIVASILLLAACRGEPVPRDYQNAPPSMTSPADSSAESPAQHGMGEPAPQPTTGVEGPGDPYVPVTPSPEPTTTTISDTPPATTTT
jgi:hypothetical protein